MKRVTLLEWATMHYSQPPKLPTLRAWAASGRIQPAPVLTGRTYQVLPDAVYVDAANDDAIDGASLSGRALAILTG